QSEVVNVRSHGGSSHSDHQSQYQSYAATPVAHGFHSGLLGAAERPDEINVRIPEGNGQRNCARGTSSPRLAPGLCMTGGTPVLHFHRVQCGARGRVAREHTSLFSSSTAPTFLRRHNEAGAVVDV